MPNSETLKLLSRLFNVSINTLLGTQLQSEFDQDRCFGVLANMDFILISTYGADGADPELILYRKR